MIASSPTSVRFTSKTSNTALKTDLTYGSQVKVSQDSPKSKRRKKIIIIRLILILLTYELCQPQLTTHMNAVALMKSLNFKINVSKSRNWYLLFHSNNLKTTCSVPNLFHNFPKSIIILFAQ